MQKLVYTGLAFLLVLSCRKGEFKANKAPETRLSLEAINLSGENRLNSEVRLSWYGTDADGYVKGFEISLDQQNWHFTTVQDSVFLFSLTEGQDTTDVDFYVRSVDDDDNVDETPAYLRIPLRNTPPNAKIDNDRGPGDTAFCVSTFYWTASDPDGNETVSQVYLKFNDGEWTEVNKNQNLISFLADTNISSGSASAQIYYGKNKSPENFTIDGLQVNGENVLYIKAVDLAGAESSVDTSVSFYLKNKTAGVSTLWVNGHNNTSITQSYRSYLLNNAIAFDLLDYGIGQGERQPVYWDPTFRITLSLYKKVFINAPSAVFQNPVTGQNTTLLNYVAPIIQSFQDNGGKSFTTCILDKTEDVTNIAGPFPLENIVTSAQGLVRIYADSIIYPVSGDPGLPDLQPVTTQIGVSPIVKAADSEDFYRAQLTPISGWQGDNLVATVRRDVNGNMKQVFFAIELHNYNKDNGAEQLIGQVLKNEF